MKNKPQLITYPDSLGGNLSALAEILENELAGHFGGVHILPPFPSSGDRGFAPLTYADIEPGFGTWEDIRRMGGHMDVVLDMMVNHISAQSEFFKDYLEKGKASRWADLFLPLKKLWKSGEPDRNDLEKIFLRRERPYSTFKTGDGEVKVWTTFGQEDPSEQIDLDVMSQVTRELLREFFENFGRNNVNMVRLDAVGYVIKKLGTSCFFVEPEIFGFMDWIGGLAAQYGIELLPEVHAHHETARRLSDKGWYTYDFILPYRVLEALLLRESGALVKHLQNSPATQVTVLDCHDGIPVKPDVDDLYDHEKVKKVTALCAESGAKFSLILSDEHKDPDGFDVHQICGTLYEMLGKDDNALVAARAIQLFAPGIPQVYYAGLLASVNDKEQAAQTGDIRELNRHNYSREEIAEELKRPVIQRLMKLIRFRNECGAFTGSPEILPLNGSGLSIRWSGNNETCELLVKLEDISCEIRHTDVQGGAHEWRL